MRSTITALTLAIALPLVAACGSAPKATSQSAPVAATPGGPGGDAENGSADGVSGEPVDRFAPIPEPEWTGAFRERAVLLARAIRVEGPAPLLSHVVAASDDALYERSVQTTEQGLQQVIRRASDEVQVVRGHLDAWRLAAEERIVILERVAPGPVVVIADGDVMWRDPDGEIERGDRLEFVGEIGNMTPTRPGSVSAAMADESDAEQTTSDADTSRAPEGEGADRD